MAFAADGRVYRRARPGSSPRELRDVELGIADRPLHWRQAMERIYGEPRGYDTFKRLITHGAIVNGRAVVLGSVARPGGRRVMESQVNVFVVEYERLSGEGIKASRHPGIEAFGRRAMDGVERPRPVAGVASPASANLKHRGLRLVGGHGDTDVGTRLDVSA